MASGKVAASRSQGRAGEGSSQAPRCPRVQDRLVSEGLAEGLQPGGREPVWSALWNFGSILPSPYLGQPPTLPLWGAPAHSMHPRTPTIPSGS